MVELCIAAGRAVPINCTANEKVMESRTRSTLPNKVLNRDRSKKLVEDGLVLFFVLYIHSDIGVTLRYRDNVLQHPPSPALGVVSKHSPS